MWTIRDYLWAKLWILRLVQLFASAPFPCG